MCNTDTKKNKGPFRATVRSNVPIGPRFYRISFEFINEGAAAFAKALPGQFLELKVEDLSVPCDDKIPDDLKDATQRHVLLRRPFSFVDIEINNDKVNVDVLYCVLGASTVRMTALKQGDCVSITGPLGNGFNLPEGTSNAILVAGGMGAPPLQHFAKYLSINHPNVSVTAFVGAKSSKDMPFFSIQNAKPCGHETFVLQEFASCGACSHIATDDGTIGFKGFVTQNLMHWLEENKVDKSHTVIYGCGPEVMLASLAKVARDNDIACQVSMERRMACGIGLCQSCAIEVIDPAGSETYYKLCCKDGPVFNSREIAW